MNSIGLCKLRGGGGGGSRGLSKLSRGPWGGGGALICFKREFAG